MNLNVLIVDDNKEHNNLIREAIETEDITVYQAYSPVEALRIADRTPIDICLADLVMPEMDGIMLMQELKKKSDVEVIIITGHGSIENAVLAMQKGAYSYITKPINIDELRVLLEKVKEKVRLKRLNAELQKRLNRAYSLKNIIGNSAPMRRVFEIIHQVAGTDATVLIQGESGTGKELIAQAIHQLSPRAPKNFVAVNCAAISSSLLESELFGYVKGAFTGANKDKVGFFEYADGGTLFLDEIAELPLELQPKLLRVLEEKKIIRVGSTKPVPVDVRVIAATNKDLFQQVREGKFREDLYYRLNVVSIYLPPLRERKSDIILLANHFLNLFKRKYKKNIEGFEPEVLKVFYQYNWPGNVRELKNCIESMVVLSKSEMLTLKEVPHYIIDSLRGDYYLSFDKSEQAQLPADVPESKTPTNLRKIDELEKNAIIAALQQTGGNRKKAAEILGISDRTLYRKIKVYGIKL